MIFVKNSNVLNQKLYFEVQHIYYIPDCFLQSWKKFAPQQINNYFYWPEFFNICFYSIFFYRTY